MVGAEFGCFRQNKGLWEYLADVDRARLNAQKWHWAFYAFREDSWDGMDYEVGTGKLPWKYWQDVEDGQESGTAAGRQPALCRHQAGVWNLSRWAADHLNLAD